MTGPWTEPRSAKKKRWRRSPNRALCRSRNKQSKTRMAGPYTGLGASWLEAGGECDEKGRRSADRPGKVMHVDSFQKQTQGLGSSVEVQQRQGR